MILHVERNDNCINLEPTELQEVSPPVQLARIRVRWKSMPGGTESLTEEFIWSEIWGWSSQEGGTRSAAYAQRVIDSEGDEGIIVYGGDWGVKILVNNEEIGRNVLWVGIDVASDDLPLDILEVLGLKQP